MTRYTEREKKFKNWCEENGGEFEIIANESRCEHPEGGKLKFEDPAFERQHGDLVVPWSTSEDNRHDPIMFKGGRSGPNGFGDVEIQQTHDDPESSITFLDRREYEFVTIDFQDDKFAVHDKGKY